MARIRVSFYFKLHGRICCWTAEGQDFVLAFWCALQTNWSTEKWTQIWMHFFWRPTQCQKSHSSGMISWNLVELRCQSGKTSLEAHLLTLDISVDSWTKELFSVIVLRVPTGSWTNKNGIYVNGWDRNNVTNTNHHRMVQKCKKSIHIMNDSQ